MDSYEGWGGDPLSLHKYLYANNDPVNALDPSGHDGDYISTVAATDIYVGLQTITVVSTQGVIEVAEAPAAVSAVQAALQWVLTFGVAALLVTQTGDNPPTQTGKKRPPTRHSGRLQVQGGDITGQTYDLGSHPDFNYSGDTLSWPWSQSTPLLAYTALSKLSEFLQILTPAQNGRRKPAFVKASQFIVNASIAGGVWAPVTIPPFNAGDARYPDARIDIEVQSGQAFVPIP